MIQSSLREKIKQKIVAGEEIFFPQGLGSSELQLVMILVEDYLEKGEAKLANSLFTSLNRPGQSISLGAVLEIRRRQLIEEDRPDNDEELEVIEKFLELLGVLHLVLAREEIVSPSK